MPKPTFHNLPIEKRERFLGAALDEFALHDYRSASVSRIVETLGIAKGSVYQYFHGKMELYRYVVEMAADTKFRSIDAAMPPDVPGFFERFELTVFHGAAFDFSQPRFASILYNATYEPSPETIDVSAQLKRASYRYLGEVVRAGIAEGDLRDDVDVGFAVFALYHLTVSLRDYLSERFDFSFRAAVYEGSGPPIDEQDLRSVIAELVAVLRRGLQAP
jgi:AcrR family transcriptional regulator